MKYLGQMSRHTINHNSLIFITMILTITYEIGYCIWVLKSLPLTPIIFLLYVSMNWLIQWACCRRWHDIFKFTVLCVNCYISTLISLKCVPKDTVKNKTLVQIMAWSLGKTTMNISCNYLWGPSIVLSGCRSKGLTVQAVHLLFLSNP